MPNPNIMQIKLVRFNDNFVPLFHEKNRFAWKITLKATKAAYFSG